MPLVLALLFAILLRPVVQFLNKKLRFPHVVAVLVAVILFVCLVLGIIIFISYQLADFAEDWPKIKENMHTNYEHVQQWVKRKFNVSYKKQESYIDNVTKDTMKNGKDIVGNTLSSFSETLLNVILIPIYTFLILLYRNLFKKFLAKLTPKSEHPTLVSILKEIKSVVQSYIVGLLIEMGIVAVLTTGGLMLIGVPYAILLGTITAILNLIPYIGILVAGVISIVVALTNSTDVSIVAGVIGVNVVVQLIDNNFLIPKVVASKVKLNALVSIVAVFVGGALAGVIGMFLAIPISAILKVIFDRIQGLEPFGFLLGDDMPKTYEWGKIKLPAWSAGSDTENDHYEVETPKEKLVVIEVNEKTEKETKKEKEKKEKEQKEEEENLKKLEKEKKAQEEEDKKNNKD
ncbi:MAG: AI-2E family transporter [Bacteroidota bacterium]|nr:AI-2E family transporter [Bacteroidota bacterium]